MFGRAACTVAAVALVLAAPTLASARVTRSVTAGVDAKAWCSWMVRVNTKYGLMKNKRYLPEDKMTIAGWKGVIDTTLAQQKRYIAMAPAALKSVLTHEVAYYARVKSKGYILSKAKLGSFTLAELKKVVSFQRTQCGIVFPPAT